LKIADSTLRESEYELTVTWSLQSHPDAPKLVCADNSQTGWVPASSSSVQFSHTTTPAKVEGIVFKTHI